MFVAASQVPVTVIPPLVVSAVRAKANPLTLLIAVTVEATIEVDAAFAFLMMSHSIFQAAEIVPPNACCRATTMPENA